MNGQRGGGRFRTGEVTLDGLFMGGGLPRGVLIELSSVTPELSSPIAKALISGVIADGGVVALLCPGGDPPEPEQESERLLFSQPDSGAHALMMAALLLQSAEVDLVVVAGLQEAPYRNLAGPLKEAAGHAQGGLLGVIKRSLQKYSALAATAGQSMDEELRNLAALAQMNGSGVLFVNRAGPGGPVSWHASIRIRVEALAVRGGSRGGRNIGQVPDRVGFRVTKGGGYLSSDTMGHILFRGEFMQLGKRR